MSKLATELEIAKNKLNQFWQEEQEREIARKKNIKELKNSADKLNEIISNEIKRQTLSTDLKVEERVLNEFDFLHERQYTVKFQGLEDEYLIVIMKVNKDIAWFYHYNGLKIYCIRKKGKWQFYNCKSSFEDMKKEDLTKTTLAKAVESLLVNAIHCMVDKATKV